MAIEQGRKRLPRHPQGNRRPGDAEAMRFIDKYLGLVTIGFVIAVVGGFLALTLLGGGSEEAKGKCERLAVTGE